MPRLKGRRTTTAPAATAAFVVSSLDPSSTTTTSIPGSKSWISETTAPIAASSSNAGTTATIRGLTRAPGRRPLGGWRLTEDVSHVHRRLELEEPQHQPGAVAVGVLVQDALSRAGAPRGGLARVVEEHVVRLERRLCVVHDEQLLTRLEPPLDPRVRVRDDRRAGRGELERPARRGALDRRVHAPGQVQVDAGGRDRAREHVERHVADDPRAADVPLEVPAAEREVDPRVPPARLPDERGHPLAAELVAVAVEEDVVLLLDLKRPEELGVGR